MFYLISIHLNPSESDWNDPSAALHAANLILASLQSLRVAPLQYCSTEGAMSEFRGITLQYHSQSCNIRYIQNG